MTEKIKKVLEDWSLLIVALVAIGVYWEIKQMEYDIQHIKDGVIALKDEKGKVK